jgi:plastocyanin
MRAPIPDSRILLAVGCTIMVAGGCSDGLATRPSIDPSTFYWSLALNHRAVTLSTTAPYDTVRLTATPLNPAGAPLAGLGVPTFTSTDLARVRVSADGVVQAVAEGVGIAVIASLQAGNVTHVDTAFIDITSDPAPRPLASLSIHPVPPDSAKVAADPNDSKQLPVYALSTENDTLEGLRVDFRSSDPTIATVESQTGIVHGQRPGQVSIVASATAYGATRADTLSFTVGLPIWYWIAVDPAPIRGSSPATTFTPSEITVGTGATVLWQWRADIPATDVTFDDPTNVAESPGLGPLHIGASGSGNIPAPDCRSANPAGMLFNCTKARTFPVPGVYRFRSTLTGATGQVTVVDEHTAPSR